MSSRIIALTLPLMLTTACGVSGPEEVVEDSREPIVGGQATSSLPAVGVILRYGSTHCTGTVVERRKILTAAHCLAGVSANSLTFGIGPNVGQLQTVIPVASITPHPNYNSTSYQNDIGYITLAADAPVEPMGVVPSMDASWVGRELTFVGYGLSNGFTKTGAGTKRFVKMPVSQVGATQFAYNTSGRNTCSGDSGGPAFADVNGSLLVAGVTSYGDANCVQYGVDTRVDTFANFLDINDDPSPVDPPADPCNGETFEGRCDGNRVIWCENEEVKQLNCPNSCGFDASKGYYNCQ